MKISLQFRNNFILTLVIIFLFISSVDAQVQVGYELCSRKNQLSLNLNSVSDYPGDISIDAVYYFLDLEIKISPNLLIGAVTGTYRIVQSGINSFYLDFSSNMSVDSVIFESLPLNFLHSNDKLKIFFNSPFSKGDIASLTVYYNGVPDPTGYGSFTFGTNEGEPSIYTLSQPFGAKDWWPCKDTPGDKADSSEVWLTTEAHNYNLSGVSNGDLYYIRYNNNGTRTFMWRNSYPIAPYLISIAVSDYALYDQFWNYSSNNLMPVKNYIYPQHLQELIPQLDKTIPMLDFYSGLFGIYPFYKEKYGHVEFGILAGMEHQTISSMGAWYDGIIAHELVHQWFGDKLTCADWNNIWLNEGFATYGEALWQEFSYGDIYYRNFIDRIMVDAKRATGTIYVHDVSSVENIFNPFRTYAKGGVVLHMLRGIVGNQVFFDILHAYANDPRFAYKTVVTSDFQQICDSVSGMNLDYFFSQWIYGENYPKYNVDWSFKNTQGVNYEIDLTITQPMNSNPQFFTMPIEIQIKTDLVDTLMKFFNNSQLQIFNFTLPGKPQSIIVDPDNKILKEVHGNIFDLPVSFRLEQNYPNPFNPATTIIFELGRVSNVTITVYDALGKHIRTLVNEKLREGRHETTFDATGLASGLYICNINAVPEDTGFEAFSDSKPMLYIK
ncbi:MAG: M1 family aminopeptidase [Ignavibacteriaceae bacterium]|nr:M1 family aminopeptidase [Ignavibacteriaceae bacterium]